MNDLISPQKAAEMLGVCSGTLRKWAEAKKLTVVKTMGNHRRYKLIEIKQLVEASKESN